MKPRVEDRPAAPEELLRRFRAEGDVRALGALFDEVAPELYRVALRLSPDAPSAEDALQETWLAAIEAADRNGPIERPIERVVPWLVGILKNKVRRIRRDARREPPAPPAELTGGGPLDDASRTEALGRVRAALDDLPEPYREVAILRWRYGLEPSEIADARGVPPGTVRSLLSRAAEKLRPKLGSLSMVLGIRPVRGLDAIREAVLSRAAEAVGATGAAGALALGGALVMGKKIAAIVAVLVLLLAGGIAVRGPLFGEGPPEKPPSAPPPAIGDLPPASTGTGTEQTASTPGGGSTAPAPADAASPEAEEPVPGRATVAVTWDDGKPAAGIFVRALSWDGPDPLANARELPTGPDGRVRFDGLPPGRVTFYLDRGGSAGSTVEEGKPCSVAMKVRDGVDVNGLVVDRNGKPVAAADVWLSDYGNHRDGRIVGKADETGRFRIRDVSPEHAIGARAAGHAPSGLYSVTGPVGRTIEARLELRGPGAAVTGRVVRGTGAPVPGARVHVGLRFTQNVVGPDGTVIFANQGLELTTDGEGRFTVTGCDTGPTLVKARAPGLGPAEKLVTPDAGETVDVELVLSEGASVTGVVLDTEGKPVPKAQVLVGRYGEFASSSANADAEGRYRLDGLASGTIEVRASREGVGKDRANVETAAGGVTTWNPVLGKGRVLRGRVTDEDGEPCARWGINLANRQQVSSWQRAARTDEEGRFEILNVPADSLRLKVYARVGGDYTAFPSATVDDPPLDGPPVEIVVDTADLPSARITGKVLDPEGGPVGETLVTIYREGSNFPAAAPTEKDTGRFRSDLLPPGIYRVDVRVPGSPGITAGPWRIEANEVKDAGALRLAAGGHLIVYAKRADREALVHAWGSIVPQSGGEPVWINFDKGVARTPPVPAGTHVVRVDQTLPDRSFLGFADVEVRAGTKEVVDVVLEPAVRRTLRVAFPPGTAPDSSVRYRVRDASGRYVLDSRLPPLLTFAFLPGTHTVEVTTPSGLRGSATFEATEETAPVEIEVR